MPELLIEDLLMLKVPAPFIGQVADPLKLCVFYFRLAWDFTMFPCGLFGPTTIALCSFIASCKCFCEPVVAPVVYAAKGVLTCVFEMTIQLPWPLLDCLLLTCLWMTLIDLLLALALPDIPTTLLMFTFPSVLIFQNRYSSVADLLSTAVYSRPTLFFKSDSYFSYFCFY